jgi:hypothetical protein
MRACSCEGPYRFFAARFFDGGLAFLTAGSLAGGFT